MKEKNNNWRRTKEGQILIATKQKTKLNRGPKRKERTDDMGLQRGEDIKIWRKEGWRSLPVWILRLSASSKHLPPLSPMFWVFLAVVFAYYYFVMRKGLACSSFYHSDFSCL
jgi:hypothetical protein